MEINKIYKFNIIDTGMNFEGIAKTDEGLTVFIPGALISETVMAKITKINKYYALGKIVEIVEPSKLRQEVDCKYYSACGGCMAMETTYDNTLEIKRKIVINSLRKQKLDENLVKEIYGMGNPYYYRNKVQYPVRNIKDKNVVGMYQEGTHTIINNKECLIQDKITHQIARELFEICDLEGLNGYNEQLNSGDIRNILVRRGTHTGEIMCVIVVTNSKLASDERMNKVVKKIAKHKEISSIMLNVNNAKTNVILSNENICIYGKAYITDIIGDYVFKITADSFFQVNTIQAEVLYNLLKEGLELENNKNLLELYSGVGSIGIFLSNSVKNIYSVEIVESAVEAAKENAKMNNIQNIIHINGDASKETLKLVNEGKTFDYIVVDPPRKGLDLEGIELILKLKPEKIGYISCSHATFARDLKLLSSDYDIKYINLVDMFPWTSHVECVAVLCRKTF